MKQNPLIRIRFPRDVTAKLDELARNVGVTLKRRIPRAAVVRAMICLCWDATAQEITTAIGVDTVRRGRTSFGRQSRRRTQPRRKQAITGPEALRLLADNVRRIRKQRGLTQRGAAALAGIHWTHWAKIEGATINSTTNTIVGIATALDVPIADLFSPTGVRSLSSADTRDQTPTVTSFCEMNTDHCKSPASSAAAVAPSLVVPPSEGDSATAQRSTPHADGGTTGGRGGTPSGAETRIELCRSEIKHVADAMDLVVARCGSQKAAGEQLQVACGLVTRIQSRPATIRVPELGLDNLARAVGVSRQDLTSGRWVKPEIPSRPYRHQVRR